MFVAKAPTKIVLRKIAFLLTKVLQPVSADQWQCGMELSNVRVEAGENA